MSESGSNDRNFTEKPVSDNESSKFPPFPDPTDEDFEEDISEEERNHYKNKYPDLNTITSEKLHCTACDRHLGCSARNDSRMRVHPMLRTLVCHTCHTFYNSGEFDKGEDGSELYCRWCGQGGQVYCCSDCPHVFCAKCIRRNLGAPKIKEIENTDDWKCFKCNPKCLWDLRALCWALLRYCDLKNKITHKTEDPHLKEIYVKDCASDNSECCKAKSRRKEKEAVKKKDDKKEKSQSADDSISKKTASAVISKMPPSIQVKKFATMIDDYPKPDKKPIKRPASPKPKPIIVKNPIGVSLPNASMSNVRAINPVIYPPLAKKIKISTSTPIINPIRFSNDRKIQTYVRNRPKASYMPIPTMSSNQYNGYSRTHYNNVANDNINLSLESLTQGLDMAAVANMANAVDNDVICTPDFPIEPLCEVAEDNTDDDVQCMTPAPMTAPKINAPPPLVTRAGNSLLDMSPDNIIQMTENDVTVNSETGGLKFRVDPQTLSSNKMYRLPDGRIFAINANPTMPGGYSATIVAVTENMNKVIPKGATYAAKLNAVLTSQPNTPSPPPAKPRIINVRSTSTATSSPIISKSRISKADKVSKVADRSRDCDLNVPVEWFRYNILDAVDALEYSLQRLQKLKKVATTMYLRTRTISEIRSLHRTLHSLLNTSSSRFKEIKETLDKDLKVYLQRKADSQNSEEDDDDVEILQDRENDDPIFIDENSTDSATQDHQVDLTGQASSDYNDSGEITNDKSNTFCNEVHQERSKQLSRVNNTIDCKMSSDTTNKFSSSNDTHGIEHDKESINIDKDVVNFDEKIGNDGKKVENDAEIEDMPNANKTDLNDEQLNEQEAADEKLSLDTNSKHNEQNYTETETNSIEDDKKSVENIESSTKNICDEENAKPLSPMKSDVKSPFSEKNDNMDEDETDFIKEGHNKIRDSEMNEDFGADILDTVLDDGQEENVAAQTLNRLEVTDTL